MNKWNSKKLLRRNLYMQVVQELGIRIIKGDIKTGAPLPVEDELGEEFGVSRTVVREATKVLAGKGLITSRPRLGTLVMDQGEWNRLDPDVLGWEIEHGDKLAAMRNITDVREVVEPQASKLAALRASDKEIDQITKAFQKMENAIEDSIEFMENDFQFHTTIIESSQSPILIQLSKTLRDALIACRKTIALSPGSSQKALPFHANVLHAIQKRDAQAAYETMQRLIENAWLDIDDVLGN